MASNITKILFRRGTDSQRRTGGGTGVTPQAGEPIFCTDSKRLFIGDDTTVGGVPAGVTNYGQVSALFGSYNGSALDYAAWTIFNSKSVAAGDLIYDQSTSLLYTLTGTPAPIPALSSFVSYPSKLNVNTNQFTFSGSNNQLNIKDGGINALQINSAALDNLTLDNSGAGGTLRIRDGNITNGVTNTKLTYAPANSVKGNITGSTGGVTDLALTTGNIQFVGTTDSSNLTAVLLTSGTGVGLSVVGNSVSVNNTVSIASDDGILFDEGNPVVGSNVTINANNSLQYFKYGDFRPGTGVTTIQYTADDTTTLSMYSMPWTNADATKPAVTFESIALGPYAPQVTIFWLATGANLSTVFYTNSAYVKGSTTKPSPWSPNKTVLTMLRDDNILYIGGNFTTLGTTARNRIGVINLSGGPTYTSGTTYLGPRGTLSSFNNSILDSVGFNGPVKKILKFTYGSTNFLCIGGNFTNHNGDGNAAKLVIYSGSPGAYTLAGAYALNGTVCDMLSAGKYLYVAGSMTTGKLNTLVTSTAVTMDGLTRIDMSTANPLIDTTFTAAAASYITSMGTYGIDSLAYYKGLLYAGGWHQVKQGTAVTQKFLTAHYTNASDPINPGTPGNIVQNFRPVYAGSRVFKLAIDTPSDGSAVLYVGGYYNSYTPYGYTTKSIKNLMAFDLDVDSGVPGASWITGANVADQWKPNPSSYGVTQIEPVSGTKADALYVGGYFTSIAGKSQKYLAAISKPYTVAGLATVLNWPTTPNKTLYASEAANPTYGGANQLLSIPTTHPLSGVLVSGGFSLLGGATRPYVGRAAGYNQSVLPTLSSVGFDIASTAIGDGDSLGVDTTTMIYVTGYPGPQDTVNALTYDIYSTVFTLSGNWPNFNRGDLARFYLRRTGGLLTAAGAINTDDPLWQLYGSNGLPSITANDLFSKPIYLMGVNIDWNTKSLIPPASGS